VLLQNYAVENLNQLRRITPVYSATLSLYLPFFDAHSYVHKCAQTVSLQRMIWCVAM